MSATWQRIRLRSIQMHLKVRNLTAWLLIWARLVSRLREVTVITDSKLLHPKGGATGLMSSYPLPTTSRCHILVKLPASEVFARVSLAELLG